MLLSTKDLCAALLREPTHSPLGLRGVVRVVSLLAPEQSSIVQRHAEQLAHLHATMTLSPHSSYLLVVLLLRAHGSFPRGRLGQGSAAMQCAIELRPRALVLSVEAFAIPQALRIYNSRSPLSLAAALIPSIQLSLCQIGSFLIGLHGVVHVGTYPALAAR